MLLVADLLRWPGVLIVGVVSVAILLLIRPAEPAGALFSRWPAESAASIAGEFAPAPQGAVAGEGVALSLAGDVGFNVAAALGARGGALRDVVIRPGETWSFNATVGDPAGMSLRTVAGIYGGGWCDLASRYVQAVRPILPEAAVRFPNHVATAGIRLSDVADSDAVAIWNIDGQPGSFGGRQDLEITNTTTHTIRLVAASDGGVVRVRAYVID
jgi:hypothetical protein